MSHVRYGFSFVFFSDGYPVCLYHNRINLSHAVFGLALHYSWYVCRYVCLYVYMYVCVWAFCSIPLVYMLNTRTYILTEIKYSAI